MLIIYMCYDYYSCQHKKLKLIALIEGFGNITMYKMFIKIVHLLSGTNTLKTHFFEDTI
jgi:hypothetical protein